jgi:hypothetical protein
LYNSPKFVVHIAKQIVNIVKKCKIVKHKFIHLMDTNMQHTMNSALDAPKMQSMTNSTLDAFIIVLAH